MFGRRSQSDFEDEIEAHLQLEIDRLTASGMSEKDAERAARRRFGNVGVAQDRFHDAQRFASLMDAIADARYAFRTLAHNRGFAALAILTLAVGIGATASVFTLANWILLRPVPGTVNSGELVIVSFEEAPGQTTGFSYGTLQRAARDVPAFSEVMASTNMTIQLTGDGIASRELRGAIVAGDYFGVLGVRPRLGRFFTADEMLPGAGGSQVVIGSGLWESQFAGDSAVLGTTVRFNGTAFTVVGVAAPDFRGIERVGNTDAWFPPAAYGALRHHATNIAEPGRRVFRAMVARLSEGSTVSIAQSQIRAVAAAMRTENPDAYGIYESQPPTVYRDIGTPIYGRDRAAQTVRLLFAVVAVVLIIACANVANLLLLRALVRAPEFAVRRALGASRMRLLRLHSAEGVLIGVAGGMLAIGMALGVARVLFSGRQFNMLQAAGDIGMDWRVLAFVFGLATLTGLVFGLIPAMVSMREVAQPGGLAEAGRRSSGGGGRVRAALMTVQVAGCVTLLACGALLGRSLRALHDIDLGFEPVNLVKFQSIPDLQGYSDERLNSVRPQILSALRTTPGIESATLATYGVPQEESYVTDLRRLEDADDQWPHDVRVSPIADGYFETLRIPLVAGRDFTTAERTPAEDGAPVIVNATLARRVFGDQPAVGQVVIERGLGGPVRRRVVGVVADARASRLRDALEPVMYQPMALSFQSYIQVLVRSPMPLASLDSVVRRTIGTVDPGLPVGQALPVTTIVRDAAREERLFLKLVSLLGTMAAVLAGVGLYGVTAYAVAQRRRELGIRIALGAGVRAIVTAVTRTTAAVLVAGLLGGIAAASVLARALQSRLYGVEQFDPLSFGAAALVFSAIALAACVGPARAATKVNPTEALRLE